jgi:hypothetical protein
LTQRDVSLRRHLRGDGWVTRQVLPAVVAVVAVKAVLIAAEVHPLGDPNPLLAGLVAGTVFLLGFVLAGTLTDFKEAERLPGELAASLESIVDECLVVVERRRAPVAAACIRHVWDIAHTVRAWLERRATVEQALTAIRDLNHFFAALEPLSQGPFINRLKGEQREARRMLLRMEVIRSTSFVTAGHAVAGLLSWLVIAILLLTDVGAVGESLFFTALIAFLLVFMHRLIRDLDNPFEYRGGMQGTADVSLEPVDALESRLAAVLDGLGPVSGQGGDTAAAGGSAARSPAAGRA